MVFGLFKKKNIQIKDPIIGFYDLSKGNLAQYLNEDKDSFSCFFTSVVESNELPPKCNVLFAYCAIDADGKIRGSDLQLREIIKISGAAMVVFASRNEDTHYANALRRKGQGRANIVLTLNRKGPSFGRFFCNLFTQMQNGSSMPVAWVKLAPQSPVADHLDCPNTIMLCETGQLTFCS